MSRALIIVAVAAVIAAAVSAHAQQPAPATAPPSFEAASIRPSGGGAIDFRFFPNRFAGTNLTLGQLIEQAYNIHPRELIGGPDWLRVDRFNVTATSGAEVSQDQMRLMLRRRSFELAGPTTSRSAEYPRIRTHRRSSPRSSAISVSDSSLQRAHTGPRHSSRLEAFAELTTFALDERPT